MRNMQRASFWLVLAAFVTLVLFAVPATAAGTGGEEKTAKINLNTAGIEELTSLPGIGPAYARRIVEYREKNGPFKRVEDLLNVQGIGEKTLEKIQDRLTVSSGK